MTWKNTLGVKKFLGCLISGCAMSPVSSQLSQSRASFLLLCASPFIHSCTQGTFTKHRPYFRSQVANRRSPGQIQISALFYLARYLVSTQWQNRAWGKWAKSLKHQIPLEDKDDPNCCVPVKDIKFTL